MSNRLDRTCKRPTPPWRLALVGTDVNLHAAVREHLSKPEAGWHVKAYTSTKTAWSGIASVPPCVVLMDVAPPTATGLGCLRALRARLPGRAGGGVHRAGLCRDVAADAERRGARGYLIKPLPPADLLPYLRKALAGGLVLCPRAERLLLEGRRGLWLWHSALRLTWAEQQVMLCLCLHRRNKDRARALRISEATVHAHLASIYKKLNVHNRESALRVFTQKLHGGVKWPGAVPPGLDLFRDWHSAMTCYKRV